MSAETKVRLGWLRLMYIYTILGAGSVGLTVLIAPGFMKSVFGWPLEEPVSAGIFGSVFVAFGILSILGLRSPLKFAPVLFLQLCYKVIWFIAVFVPLLITSRLPGYTILVALVFATYIVGDLIAVPFPYIFARQSSQ